MHMLFPYPGQFWNVPVTVKPYTGPVRADAPSNAHYYTINFTHPDQPTLPRFITGDLLDITWERQTEPCFYVGDVQGGSLYEVEENNDPVIQGSYRDYQVGGPFETAFTYSHFDTSRCLP